MKRFSIHQLVDLDDDTIGLLDVVRDFVDRDVLRTAQGLERADEYPADLVRTMREIGLFGLTIPQEYGGAGASLLTYALVQVELSSGWMSLSGILNTHFIVSWMIERFGTDEQKARLLPRMASGELRAAYSMTEPHAGSDIKAIRTMARRVGDDYLVAGQKMWSTNGFQAGLILLLTRTDDGSSDEREFSALLVEKEPARAEQPGLLIPPKLRKLGYKGVETTELVFDGFPVPVANVLGGPAGLGRGVQQCLSGVEVGRVNVAARGVGLATRALDEAARYARDRTTFGKPITEHQLIQAKLADMATRLQAARLLLIHAARTKDTGARSDLEVGMAKLFATETATWMSLEAMRIHGGYGYSQEYVVERLYRDAPLLVLGEGTSEIQKLVIARRLLERLA